MKQGCENNYKNAPSSSNLLVWFGVSFGQSGQSSSSLAAAARLHFSTVATNMARIIFHRAAAPRLAASVPAVWASPHGTDGRLPGQNVGRIVSRIVGMGVDMLEADAPTDLGDFIPQLLDLLGVVEQHLPVEVRPARLPLHSVDDAEGVGPDEYRLTIVAGPFPEILKSQDTSQQFSPIRVVRRPIGPLGAVQRMPRPHVDSHAGTAGNCRAVRVDDHVPIREAPIPFAIDIGGRGAPQPLIVPILLLKSFRLHNAHGSCGIHRGGAPSLLVHIPIPCERSSTVCSSSSGRTGDDIMTGPGTDGTATRECARSRSRSRRDGSGAAGLGSIAWAGATTRLTVWRSRRLVTKQSSSLLELEDDMTAQVDRS